LITEGLGKSTSLGLKEKFETDKVITIGNLLSANLYSLQIP